MDTNEVKQAHENFDMAEFMSKEKENNGAIVVITPNQLICCKTENDGEEPHAFAFADVAKFVLPEEVKKFVEKKKNVNVSSLKSAISYIIESECLCCRMTYEYIEHVFNFMTPKSKTITKSQFELLQNFLKKNKEVIEAHQIESGWNGKDVSIDEMIERAREIVDEAKDISIFKDEVVIGDTIEKENVKGKESSEKGGKQGLEDAFCDDKTKVSDVKSATHRIKEWIKNIFRGKNGKEK